MPPLICLTITAKTLTEAQRISDANDPFVDILELRADHLSKNEYASIKDFPKQVKKPCILTVRRKIDGGAFEGSETERLELLEN